MHIIIILYSLYQFDNSEISTLTRAFNRTVKLDWFRHIWSLAKIAWESWICRRYRTLRALDSAQRYEWNGRNAVRARIKARPLRRFSMIVRFMTFDWVNLLRWIFHSRSVTYITVWPINEMINKDSVKRVSFLKKSKKIISFLPFFSFFT